MELSARKDTVEFTTITKRLVVFVFTPLSVVVWAVCAVRVFSANTEWERRIGVVRSCPRLCPEAMSAVWDQSAIANTRLGELSLALVVMIGLIVATNVICRKEETPWN